MHAHMSRASFRVAYTNASSCCTDDADAAADAVWEVDAALALLLPLLMLLLLPMSAGAAADAPVSPALVSFLDLKNHIVVSQSCIAHCCSGHGQHGFTPDFTPAQFSAETACIQPGCFPLSFDVTRDAAGHN